MGCKPKIYRICDKCGKRMIKKYANFVLTLCPPQHPWDWWCGCGHVEKGGIERGKTPEEVLMEAWEAANK